MTTILRIGLADAADRRGASGRPERGIDAFLHPRRLRPHCGDRAYGFGALAGSGAEWTHAALGAATLALWTLYAGLSGVVGVPYNDIVARAVRSNLLRGMAFPLSYAAVLGSAAALMGLSSFVFVAMGEPARTALLMEISPEDRRPAYSGYFNALTAPSHLLPLLGGLLFGLAGAASVFGLSLLAAIAQLVALKAMRTN